MADFTAFTRESPTLRSAGPLDARIAFMRIPSGSITHFSLACFDNVNVRHYWSDTSVSLTNAPAGPTYISATLTVIGQFSS